MSSNMVPIYEEVEITVGSVRYHFILSKEVVNPISYSINYITHQFHPTQVTPC